jgi:hypothetical protein
MGRAKISITRTISWVCSLQVLLLALLPAFSGLEHERKRASSEKLPILLNLAELAEEIEIEDAPTDLQTDCCIHAAMSLPDARAAYRQSTVWSPWTCQPDLEPGLSRGPPA